MDTQKRQKLKERFRNGALPTQDDFGALIDSFVQVDEFAEWTQQGTIELGGREGRRWRLSVPDGENLAFTPTGDAAAASATDPNPVAMRIASGTWLAMPARLGTYVSGDATRHEATTDDGPPGPLGTVPADAAWHAVITNDTHGGAYEVVAKTVGGATRPTTFDRIAHATGLRAPTAALLHGIATDAGDGSLPAVRSTVAPSRPMRAVLAVLAAICVVLGAAIAMYAAYLVPSAQCPEPWGASCLGTVVEREAGLVTSAVILFLTSIGLMVVLWIGRARTLTLAWRRSSSGNNYDLCLRGPALSRGVVYYHITRLW